MNECSPPFAAIFAPPEASGAGTKIRTHFQGLHQEIKMPENVRHGIIIGSFDSSDAFCPSARVIGGDTFATRPVTFQDGTIGTVLTSDHERYSVSLPVISGYSNCSTHSRFWTLYGVNLQVSKKRLQLM